MSTGQLDLFGAPAPAHLAATDKPPETCMPPCPDHDERHVCEECPQGYWTDHSGFVSHGICRGRLALRRCSGCEKLRTPGQWNHADWWHCIECQPLGTMSEIGRARSPHTFSNRKP